MSIIQQIREKYAAVGIGFIALSLIGFILMDSAKNNSGGGIDPNDAIGEINGRSVSYNEFLNKTRSIENMQAMNGRNVDEELRQQINSEVWRQLVDRTIMEGEFDKLGIKVTAKEFNDLLFGANPPDWLTQQFTDPNTGQFDVLAAKQAINEIKKNRSQGNAEMIEKFYLDPLLEQTLRGKYSAIQRYAVYAPGFLVEKTLSDNAAVSSFEYVQIPYSTIPDSAVQITDAMITKYISENKKDFRQEENMRSIAYVSFPYNPSASDSAAVLAELRNLYDGFANAENPGEFVGKNGSIISFANEYFSKERIQIADKDSIIGAGLGKVYGPYLDGSAYVLSRIVDIKTRPDSVKARHILVSTIDMRTQQPLLTDSAAKARIDSIEALVKSGKSFSDLAREISDDQGSAEKGGDLGYFASGMMVREFNDYCFNNSKGSRGIVRTQFGYHLIEILDQKNFAPGYNIAYLAKSIDASMETVNDAMNVANQFAGNSRSLKAFDDNILKDGLNKLIVPEIRENDYNIMGIGVNRGLVRQIFEADPGSVLDPVDMNGQYMVIAVTGVEKSGLMGVSRARPSVEPILRNQEKAKKIIKDLGNVKSLEEVASANNTFVQRADSISFVSPMISSVGFEPKIGGYAFAKQNLNNVSKPISGNSGVFLIKTFDVGATQMISSKEDIRNSLVNQTRSAALSSSAQALKERSAIKDKRSKFL